MEIKSSPLNINSRSISNTESTHCSSPGNHNFSSTYGGYSNTNNFHTNLTNQRTTSEILRNPLNRSFNSKQSVLRIRSSSGDPYKYLNLASEQVPPVNETSVNLTSFSNNFYIKDEHLSNNYFNSVKTRFKNNSLNTLGTKPKHSISSAPDQEDSELLISRPVSLQATNTVSPSSIFKSLNPLSKSPKFNLKSKSISNQLNRQNVIYNKSAEKLNFFDSENKLFGSKKQRLKRKSNSNSSLNFIDQNTQLSLQTSSTYNSCNSNSQKNLSSSNYLFGPLRLQEKSADKSSSILQVEKVKLRSTKSLGKEMFDDNFSSDVNLQNLQKKIKSLSKFKNSIHWENNDK